jgi:hypothetical protein
MATVADDAGFVLFRAPTLAASLRPYDDVVAREAALMRNAAALIDAGLMSLWCCGCALLTRAERDLITRGGTKTLAVRDFHAANHDPLSIHIRSASDLSLPYSYSGSCSCSESGSGEGPGGDTSRPSEAAPVSEQEIALLSIDPEAVLHDRPWNGASH